MKKLRRPIFAIILTCVILISSAIVSSAGADGDPGGKCYIAPPINSIQYNK